MKAKVSRAQRQPSLTCGDLSRPIVVHVCKDGTISYRRAGEPVFNGRALPVFSVNTEDEAMGIQVRFGRLQRVDHPLMPGKPWYVLSRLADGTDPAFRGDGTLELSDLDGITAMFRKHWEAFR